MKQTILDKIKSMNFAQNYRKIWPYVKPYKVRAAMAVLVTLPMGAMDASIALLLKPYMDAVIVNKSSIIPIIIVGVSLVQSGLNYAPAYFNVWVGQRITMDLESDLFNKMTHNDVAFFDKRTSGETDAL